MAPVILLETVFVIKAGKGCYATKPVPAVASHAPSVAMGDHVIKP